MERKSIGKNILNFNEQIEMIEAKRKKEKGTNQLGKNILVLFIKLEEAMMPLLVVLLLRGLRTRTRARCWNFKRGMRASATHTCRRRYTDMQTHTQRTRRTTPQCTTLSNTTHAFSRTESTPHASTPHAAPTQSTMKRYHTPFHTHHATRMHVNLRGPSRTTHTSPLNQA